MIYLDNSSTTKPFKEVTDEVAVFMNSDFGNPSSLHGLGFTAQKKVKEVREKVASMLNASSDEIIFTGGGTESDNTALKGAAEAKKRQGKKIITSAVEHAAVLETCGRLEKQGFEVIYLGVDRYGRIDLKELENEINDDTILISLMHVNNEVGAVNDLHSIGRLKGNALFHSDCVQSFAKLDIDVSGMKLDMVSLSGHKIHGPKGTGALYIRKGTNIIPLIHGGGQEKALRSGTENVPGIAGLGKACEMMDERKGLFDTRIREIRDRLRDGIMSAIPDVICNSPDDGCPYILNMSFLGTRGEVILHMLEDVGIYVSTGAACSSNKSGESHVLKAMGLTHEEIEGALRFSFSIENTTEEVDFVLENLEQTVRRFRKLGMFR